MNTQIINYKKVRCPKCGSSYFRVKENSGVDLMTLIFTTKPDPIYKDGELQNPTEAEPTKARCKCLECGCNFRVEAYNTSGDYWFIDEDEELKENERKLTESLKLKKETEKAKTELTTGTLCETENYWLEASKSKFALEASESKFATDYIKPVSNDSSKMLRDLDNLRAELDEVKERLLKLELGKKENGIS